MKNAQTIFGLIVLTAWGFLLTGCKTVSVSSFQYVGTPTYAPVPPGQIQILRAMPERPFERLGEITAEPSANDVSNLKIENALREAASKLGAEAVVITLDRVQVTGAMVSGPLFDRTVQRTTGRVIVGVAIHFTK
jgi:hypothetical protein